MKLKNKFLFLLIALTPLLLGVGGSGINFGRVGDLGGFQGTNSGELSYTFTPNSAAFGTVTNAEWKSTRVGDRLHVTGVFTWGTVAGVAAELELPAGLTIKTGGLLSSSVGTKVGTFHSMHTGGSTTALFSADAGVIFFDGSDTNTLYWANTSGSSALTKSTAAAFAGANSVPVIVEFSIPISGWDAGGSGGAELPRSMVRLSSGNGHGSTNDKIVKFSTTITNTGTAITYAASATLGDTFTINEDGVYAITYSDYRSGGQGTIGISLNSNQLTTSILSITDAHILAVSDTSGAGLGYTAEWTGILAASDVVRAHTDGNGGGSGVRTRFTITKVSN